MTDYSPEFFLSHRDGARRSAQVIVPIILDLLSVHSVIDLGCGQGTWLAVFREHGTSEICGVDGDYIDRTQLEIPADCFRAHNLGQPLRLEQRFDLAVSLEVAEHLPAECADVFVASLARLAPLVLFSAAVPFQGGTHHVNEQWPGYWAERFAAHDFVPIDCLRRRIWEDGEVEWWYAQNIMLYADRTFLQQQTALRREHEAAPTALALVHPKRFLEWVDWGLAQSRQML